MKYGEAHDTFETAIAVQDLRNGTIRKDAATYGIEDAAVILKERGDLDLEDRASTLSFARAVHEVLAHQTDDATSLYEHPRDIARGVLAAWSLDQVREFHSGREVPEDHDRFLRDIGAYDENIPAVEDGPSILDAKVWSATMECVLANASLPSGMRDGVAAWEMRLDDLGRIDDMRDHRQLHGSNGHDMGSAHDVPMDAAVHAVNVRHDHAGQADRRDEPSYDAALVMASDARRSFPGDLNPLQEALLVAEAIHAPTATRNGDGLDPRMAENALARIVARGDSAAMSAQDAARVMVVDMSIAMSARRTVREGSYGETRRGQIEPYDRILADLDGVDVVRDVGAMRSLPSPITGPIAEARYEAVPEIGVQLSISDSLRIARAPFSKPLENEIAIKLAVQKGDRDRVSDMVLGTPSSLRGPRSVAKGPGTPDPTHGMTLRSGVER